MGKPTTAEYFEHTRKNIKDKKTEKELHKSHEKRFKISNKESKEVRKQMLREIKALGLDVKSFRELKTLCAGVSGIPQENIDDIVIK